MPKSAKQKLKILYVLDILRKYSDEENPITAEKICEYLRKDGIESERKSIYSDINYLTDYGYDIIRSYSPKGFFMASREFEETEICLLKDAVSTAKFISAKKTRAVLKKLDSVLSFSQARRQRANVYFDFSQKSDNEEIFYNIDTVSRAIENNRKVSFEYITRELCGKEFVNRIKQMTVSPYALTWQDDHYYLICNYEKYDNLMHLRFDRIVKAKMSGEKMRYFGEVSEYTDYFDVADYTAKIFGMFSGKVQTVEFCCQKNIANTVADRFSEKIFITNVTENEFTFSCKAAVSDALVTFIINFGGKIKVLNPPELKEMITERAKKVLQVYKN